MALIEMDLTVPIGGGYDLTLGMKEKKTINLISSGGWSLLCSAENVKVISVIGAIEAWCTYIIKEDGTFELQATGNDTNYYVLKLENGNIYGVSYIANGAPWIITLVKE